MDHGAIGKLGNKIDDAGSSRKVSGDAGASQAAAKGQASTSDTVELTSSAKLLERLEKTLASLPAVDSSRVEEVKAAIENGEYEIDADAIADALIRFERSFGE
jgi:negative regulator of flagellin synthesis FlgM